MILIRTTTKCFHRWLSQESEQTLSSKVRGPLMCGFLHRGHVPQAEVCDTLDLSFWLKLKMAPDAGVTPAAGWMRSSWWPSGVHGRSCLSSSPLEEGGVWGKGTCKSEVLLGEHAVHALWQGIGVGRRPWHSGPQNKLPAYRRWEVGYRVLSSLLWVARPLQLLLWQSHCSSLE